MFQQIGHTSENIKIKNKHHEKRSKPEFLIESLCEMRNPNVGMKSLL
jgi:hypothetical protein